VKHFLIVLTVALVTLAILFAIYNPDLLKDTWLWLIGLLGPIVAFLKTSARSIWNWIKQMEDKNQQPRSKQSGYEVE